MTGAADSDGSDRAFEPFELSVLYAGNPAGIWLSAASRLGAVHAVPRRDPSLFPLSELGTDADWFRSAIDTGAPAMDRATQFGRLLGDLVFGVDEITSLFRRTRGAAAAGGRPLLVRLLAAPEEVAALPWELLVDPDHGMTPLVFAPDAHLVRSARDRRYPLRVDRIAPPLNVLLVLSNPTDARADDAPFDHYEEGRALLGELQELIDRGVLLVDVEDRPTIENLRRRIGARPRGYHVVHYLGHATPERLKLEDSRGRATWVPSEQFNALLRTSPDLRLTFFAGCRTASLPPTPVTPAANEFATSLSVADRCVREACQTVLGMQAVLPFRTEQVLTRFFYQSLCAGATVARSLSLARAAVRDDDVLGPNLLNWAVPTLVTGHLPGAVIDPLAPAEPPRVRPRRAQLKLDLAEPDRVFFARFSALREALNVLCRFGPKRVLCVTGAPGSGKSRLVARALDELDESIVAALYVGAPRLARDGDPLAELCELVTELLERAERRVPRRVDGWTADEWWDRLIEELVDTPFVLAIDDIDRIDPAASAALGGGVDRLVARVSKARVALVAGDQIPAAFACSASPTLAARVHLLTLAPEDVTQWVRRNRPALATALAASTEADLASIHNRLGYKLHLWEALAEELARQPVKDLLAAVDAVAAAEPSAPPHSTHGTAAEQATGARLAPGPLRVAIAGPFTTGRQQHFADGVSALALRHGAGARVVVEGAPDAATAVAQLLPTESPFRSGGAATDEDIVQWLTDLVALDPDVVLLDYGSTAPDDRAAAQLQALADAGTLLVAAAGNDGRPSWPAWREFVLGVGALDDAGRAPRSTFHADAQKPDLYAPGTVAGTPLEGVPDLPPEQAKGTSFAALNALAAAVLVWSVDRTMTAAEVGELLCSTAQPIGRARAGQPRPRRLDLPAALEAARLRLVAGGLRAGPLDEQAVAAASGLGTETTATLLKQLVGAGAIREELGRYVADDDRLTNMLS